MYAYKHHNYERQYIQRNNYELYSDTMLYARTVVQPYYSYETERFLVPTVLITTRY